VDVAVRYHDLCKKVEAASQPCSSVYLAGGHPALVEDLIEGFKLRFYPDSVQSVSGSELRQALDLAEGSRRMFIVRDAQKAFTEKEMEALLLRLDRERRNGKVRIVFVGEEPSDRVVEWFTGNRAYGEVTEPSFEKLGLWMALKTVPHWDYHFKKFPKPTLITPEDGLKLVEWVGWDYTSAVQAARSIRAYGEVLGWDRLSALIPPVVSAGYADTLVFGTGRRSALTLSQGISDEEVRRTLGLVRYYLRQFSKLRAVGAEKMSARVLAEETGVHVWHWQTKYKPMYGSFTNERIRMRQQLVEDCIRQAPAIGVLEVLAAEW
jgi:hypothetical protein